MDDEQDPIKLLEKGFDAVVMGTGLTETILSGILSIQKKRVLHIDKNKYYGGDGASLRMSQIYSKFRGESAKPPPGLDNDKNWNVDLIPKFMMGEGELTEFLRALPQVRDSVEFQNISGSYIGRPTPTGITSIFNSKRIVKVPATAMEALSSPLVGITEKNRLKNLLQDISKFDPHSQSSVHNGVDLDKTTMQKVYENFGLELATQEFVGHAMALYLNDDYLKKPARETYARVHLYAKSVASFGKSPYLYPQYGLGELPSAFTRLSAVHGGTYMLDTKVLDFEYDDDKKVKAVKIKFENPKKDGELIDLSIKTPLVIADPSYFPEGEKKVATGQKVVRAICVLDHPVKDTDEGESAQIIIPQSLVKRKHDIYIAVVSAANRVCPKGYWVAIVSTVVESDNPQEELRPALELLEPIKEMFMEKPTTLYKQKDDASDNIFISKSFDATSHFETCTEDVYDLYKRITGNPLDIKKVLPPQPAE